MEQFRALLITRDEASKKQSVGEAMLTPADLMEGDVDVRVEYSTINYKDGLAITGTLPVVRRFPMIPGVDFAGTVTASSNPDFKPGKLAGRLPAAWGGDVENEGMIQLLPFKHGVDGFFVALLERVGG